MVDVDTSFGVSDKTYDHKFVKNYDSIIGWGKSRYKLCTDNNGFRIACDKKKKKLKKFDIGFIGDSFTEGLGYNYEQTFVGIIEKKLTNKSIINLANTSYSPSIYFTKINHLINNGYTFKEIIVFIDLSDLPDDILCYQVKDEKVTRRSTYANCYDNLNSKKSFFSDLVEKNLKLTTILLNFISKKFLQTKILNEKLNYNNLMNHSRSDWTYNYKKNHFSSLNLKDALSISKKNMQDLHKLLNKNFIELSIAVYPWPGTLKYDKIENIHVKTWRDFCENKCKNFYNFMPVFFNEIDKESFYKSYTNLFIAGDVHFNAAGNKIIADEFLKKYRNKRN